MRVETASTQCRWGEPGPALVLPVTERKPSKARRASSRVRLTERVPSERAARSPPPATWISTAPGLDVVAAKPRVRVPTCAPNQASRVLAACAALQSAVLQRVAGEGEGLHGRRTETVATVPKREVVPSAPPPREVVPRCAPRETVCSAGDGARKASSGGECVSITPSATGRSWSTVESAPLRASEARNQARAHFTAWRPGEAASAEARGRVVKERTHSSEWMVRMPAPSASTATTAAIRSWRKSAPKTTVSW